MKKIVIAMLLLLPLIIVASVLLATSVISHEVYIAVEGVELNVDTSNTIELGLSQRTFQLKATVYPTGARNKEVYWEVDNVQCFGDEINQPVTIDNGKIEFSTYCTFDAVVTTVEGNKSARCNFYVKCDTLSGVDFNLPASLGTGDHYIIAPAFTPADAEVKDLTFVSSDSSVAEVDKNGVIHAKKVGGADITVRVTDKDDIYAIKHLTVTQGVTKYGTSFALSNQTFSLSSIGAPTATVVTGGTKDGDNVTFTSDVVVLDVGGTTVTISKCDYDDIVVRDKAYIESKVWYIGRLPLYLETEYLDATRSDKPGNNFSCSLPAAVELNNNKAVFKDKGVMTFSAGNASVTVEAVRPVAYVRLTTVDNEDKRGIANKTVYGTKQYKNGVESNYEIPVRIQYPSAADWSDFDLTVSDTSLAEIDGNVVRIIGSAPEQKVLTVSVTAHYSNFVSMPARANRHFIVVDGVNCFTYADVVKASKAGKNVVLRDNVKTTASDDKITLNSSLFGNAYMIDFTDTEKESEEPIVHVNASDVTVSNVTIRCDDAVKINTANGLSGVAIWAGDKENDELIENVRVEYSILENCYYAVATTKAKLTIDGCIMRNVSNFGIFVPNDWYKGYVYSEVTVNNCIMSEIVAPAIGISTFDSDGDGEALKQQSSFRQTGFLDVYNWQDLTANNMIARDYIPGKPEVNAAFRKLIEQTVVSEVKREDYAKLRYTVGDTDYIHLGAITSGAMNICTTVPTFEDERFVPFVITDAGSIEKASGIIRTFAGHDLYPIVIYNYENTADITPETKFLADKKAFAKLRGE